MLRCPVELQAEMRGLQLKLQIRYEEYLIVSFIDCSTVGSAISGIEKTAAVRPTNALWFSSAVVKGQIQKRETTTRVPPDSAAWMCVDILFLAYFIGESLNELYTQSSETAFHKCVCKLACWTNHLLNISSWWIQKLHMELLWLENGFIVCMCGPSGNICLYILSNQSLSCLKLTNPTYYSLCVMIKD